MYTRTIVLYVSIILSSIIQSICLICLFSTNIKQQQQQPNDTNISKYSFYSCVNTIVCSFVRSLGEMEFQQSTAYAYVLSRALCTTKTSFIIIIVVVVS